MTRWPGTPVGNLVLVRADGAARRPGGRAGPRRRDARRGRPGAADVLPSRWGSRPGSAVPTRPAPTRSRPCAGSTGGGDARAGSSRCGSPRSAHGLPGGAGGGPRGRLADLRPGQLVHQRASRTCWCRSWPPRSWPARPAGWSRSTSPPRPETLGLSARRPSGGAAAGTCRSSRSTWCSPTGRRWVTPNRSHRAAESLGARLVLAPVAVTGRHAPARSGGAGSRAGACPGRRSLSTYESPAITPEPAREVTTRWR